MHKNSDKSRLKVRKIKISEFQKLYVQRSGHRKNSPHKKVSQDLTEKKQDLTEMSTILMVLAKI